MPWPIAALILAESETTVLLLVRWHRLLHLSRTRAQVPRFLGPVPGWPPADAVVWAKGIATITDNEVPKFDATVCREMLHTVRLLTPAVIAGSVGDDVESNLGELRKLAGQVDQWNQSLKITSAHVLHRKQYDAMVLVEVIRLMRFLKGGANSLADVLERCLRTSIPPAFRDAFIQKASAAPKPSASTVFYYELILDIAVVLLQRSRMTCPSIRVEWSDSSQQANYDWLWSQYREIKMDRLVDWFHATIALENATEQHAGELEALPEEEAQVPTKPLDAWQPWLKTIGESVHEYVNLPAALGSGHRGLPHKAAAKVFGWAMTSPNCGDALAEHAGSYAGHTSDLGVETSLPDFFVDGHCASLLPPWFNKQDCQADVEDTTLASEDLAHLAGDSCNIAGDIGNHVDAALSDCDGPMFKSDIGEGSDVDGDILASQKSLAQSDLDGVLQDAEQVAAPADEVHVEPPVVPHEKVSWLPHKSSQESATLMPNALRIAGLQHICDNARKDVHQSLVFWLQFYETLKVFEDFITMLERRQRFCWTCLRDSEYAWAEDKLFTHFDGHLYEARWKEVVAFLEKWLPLWRVMQQTFDAHKYATRVDQSNEKKKSSARSFDLADFDRKLQCNQRYVYADMIMIADKTTSKLAGWGETCPCHSRLLSNVTSTVLRRKFFENHYGAGFTTCPNASCHAPDLAAGKLESILNELWTRSEATLCETKQFVGTQPMDTAAWAVVMEDFRRVKAASTLQLTMKNDYWQRLPWLLSGLAHCDEQVARSCGRKAKEAIQVDPRREAHDSITWRLLEPGCPFDMELDRFIAGTPRASLQHFALVVIAGFKFLPVCETTIEAKHGRVSLENRMKKLGPVRVSLANRLPMLEKWLTRGVFSLEDLLNKFEEARQLKATIHTLGIAQHPSMSNSSGMKSSHMRNRVGKMLYRCDLDNMMFSLKKPMRLHKQKQAAKRVKAARLCVSNKEVDTSTCLLQTLMRDHFAVVARDACTFSLPVAHARLQTLTEFLEKPESSKKRGHGESRGSGSDEQVLLPDHEGDEPVPVDSRMFFKMLLTNPSAKISVPVVVGAGGLISSNYVAVTFHQSQRQDGLEDSHIISGTPSALGKSRDAVFLLDLFESAPPEQVLETAAKWNKVSPIWSVKNFHIEGVTLLEIAQVIDTLIKRGAHPGCHSSTSFSSPSEVEENILNALEAHGIVTRDCRTWRLTADGLSRLSLMEKLEQPINLFSVRPDLALEDRSSMELAMMLQGEGWNWQEWISKSRQTRKTGKSPSEYRRGDELTWYSTTRSVSKYYLMCLLKSSTLFDNGLVAVPHSDTDKVYQNILVGKPAHPEHAMEFPDLDEVAQAPVQEPELNSDDEAAWLQALEEALEPAEDDKKDDDEEWMFAPSSSSSSSSKADDSDVESDDPLKGVGDGPLVAVSWGVFRFTPKQPGRGTGLFGGYQSNCPFHKLSKKSGCRKFFQVQGPTIQDRKDTVRRLTWWSLSHRDFNRQRLHIAYDAPLDHVPDHSMLMALSITEMPDKNTILDDGELDSLEKSVSRAVRRRRA